MQLFSLFIAIKVLQNAYFQFVYLCNIYKYMFQL